LYLYTGNTIESAEYSPGPIFIEVTVFESAKSLFALDAPQDVPFLDF
jgi:hypothetical protein